MVKQEQQKHDRTEAIKPYPSTHPRSWEYIHPSHNPTIHPSIRQAIRIQQSAIKIQHFVASTTKAV